MPIPPRPIPNAHAHSRRAQAQASPRARPGLTVPRKSLSSARSLIADSRAEIAFLPALPAASAPAPQTLAGIRIATAESAAGTAFGSSPSVASPPPVPRVEVALEGLIIDGRGRRERRTTTATTLGFDFVARPTVLALDDEAEPDQPVATMVAAATGPEAVTTTPPVSASAMPVSVPAPAPVFTPRTSLLSAMRGAFSVTRSMSTSPATPTLLSGTPTTPTLIPAHAQTVSDDEDDEWEHVSQVGDDANDDVESTILGEMEMDHPQLSTAKTSSTISVAASLSYAAALRT